MKEDWISGYIWYATSEGIWDTSMDWDIKSYAEAAFEDYLNEDSD